MYMYEKRIYLPNDDQSLKEYTIFYNYDNVLKYINQKSVELGAKEEQWGTRDPREWPRCFKSSQERICKQTIYCSKEEIHDFINGCSHNSHYEDNYSIFSNEHPIIENLVSAIKIKKNCINQFKRNFILAGIRDKILRGKELSIYLEEYPKNLWISFESLIEYLSYQDIITEFLSFFRIENERTVSYNTLKENVINIFDELENMDATFNEESSKIEILKYLEEQFNQMKKSAIENEKVLRITR